MGICEIENVFSVFHIKYIIGKDKRQIQKFRKTYEKCDTIVMVSKLFNNNDMRAFVGMCLEL